MRNDGAGADEVSGAAPTGAPGPDGGPTAVDSGAAAAPRGPARHRRSSGGSFLKELPFLVVVAFGLALLIKAFLVQAFFIPSGSMEQTLAIKDRVLVNKLVYDFRDVRRGEVVVFNGEGSFTPDPGQLVAPEPADPLQRVLRAVGSAVGVGAPGEKDFIKRVVGLPGDRVACCTNGHVTVQAPGGQPVELVEPYVYQNESPMVFCAAGLDEGECPAGAPGVLVPDGRLFVLGDHRCCSSDSRLHLEDGNNGTVPEDKVIGRAFVVVWPVGRAGLLQVPDTFGLPALAAGAAHGVPYALGLVGAVPVLLVRRALAERWHRRWRRRA